MCARGKFKTCRSMSTKNISGARVEMPSVTSRSSPSRSSTRDFPISSRTLREHSASSIGEEEAGRVREVRHYEVLPCELPALRLLHLAAPQDGKPRVSALPGRHAVDPAPHIQTSMWSSSRRGPPCDSAAHSLSEVLRLSQLQDASSPCSQMPRMSCAYPKATRPPQRTQPCGGPRKSGPA